MKIKDWISRQWHIFKVHCSYRFPYYDWWQCRKYIKRPHWHLSGCGRWGTNWYFGLPISLKYYNPIFSIKTGNVGWKDKYNSPRFEWNPYFAIVIFRRWMISWTLCWSKDYVNNMTTWETILSHNYYGTDIKTFAKENYWIEKDNKKHYINTLK